MKARANGMELEYESFGNPADPTILLIMGLGAQLTLWSLPFVEALVERGFHVVRYDNRDVGLSTKLDHARPPRIGMLVLQRLLRLRPRVPYTIGDMAADAAGLLDALGIEKAHIVGASMGGMIAQVFAATYPDRTLSLTSIMSTTGNPRLSRASREAMDVLVNRPKTDDFEALVAHGVRASKVLAGPAFPVEPEVLEARVRETIQRSNYPDGFARQVAAIVADGDRRERLKTIKAPAVVIHGTDDTLVPIDGGRDTAASIPGARLVEVRGMGHNVPVEVIPEIVDAIESVAR
ncbi:alpha/beta fold hydrolase [Sphingomonas sp. Ag1]|jgi:pimeloyl-ACP methyl ester carboxylesterase|uniref:alpha/beta fold hydrolase n=1 Tax=Sphingomonas sp. Ag1 TaxID=1642949 RepID=UPI0006218656|nr:alpha/beta hydrolase [Sphingomonas sp. Ag1]KKI17666.1 alpha/beta hydrolase [Sphingomonas sp. Ag1]